MDAYYIDYDNTTTGEHEKMYCENQERLKRE